MGASPLFSPKSEAEAEREVDELLHRSPQAYGIRRSRWRLQDVSQALDWLNGYSCPGIYKVLKRLGFSRKQALRFIRSPDPNYREKWQRILNAYAAAYAQGEKVVLLFQDEFTYFRNGKVRKVLQKRGQLQRRYHHQPGTATKARITATLNAVTGEVLYLQRSKIGRKALAAFYAQIRQAHPDAQVIYLVQDNWPIHLHPDVQAAAANQGLTLLPLPIYASWLNPIEKLWRWLRQDILHNYDDSLTFSQLQQQVADWLEQFTRGSYHLLNYVGILTKDELDSIPVLNC